MENEIYDMIELDIQLEEQGQAYWESLFNEMNFPGMDLMAVQYNPREISNIEEHQKLLNRTIHDFIRFLSYHHANDLRSAGVSERAPPLKR